MGMIRRSSFLISAFSRATSSGSSSCVSEARFKATKGMSSGDEKKKLTFMQRNQICLCFDRRRFFMFNRRYSHFKSPFLKVMNVKKRLNLYRIHVLMTPFLSHPNFDYVSQIMCNIIIPPQSNILSFIQETYQTNSTRESTKILLIWRSLPCFLLPCQL